MRRWRMVEIGRRRSKWEVGEKKAPGFIRQEVVGDGEWIGGSAAVGCARWRNPEASAPHQTVLRPGAVNGGRVSRGAWEADVWGHRLTGEVLLPCGARGRGQPSAACTRCGGTLSASQGCVCMGDCSLALAYPRGARAGRKEGQERHIHHALYVEELTGCTRNAPLHD